MTKPLIEHKELHLTPDGCSMGTIPVKPVTEPCHWCGSTAGTTDEYDGWDRCVDCKGC